MNREEEFKKSLENILGSKSFAFDETNWLAARELMDARRRRRRLLVLLPAALLVGIAGIYLLWPQDNKTFAINQATKLEEEQAALKENTINVQNSAVPLPSAEITSAPAPKAESKTVYTAPQTKTTVTSGSTKKTRPDKQQAQKNNFSTKAPVKEYGNYLANNPGVSQKEIDVAGIFVTEPNSNKSEFVDGVNPNDTIKNPGDEKALANDEQSGIKNLKTQEPELLSTLEDKNLTPSKKDSLILPQSAPPSSPEQTLAVTAVAKDSVKPALPNVTPEPAYFVLLEGGASYLFGWKNPAGRDANGLNPVLGLHLLNRFTKTMALSVGVQFQSVRNLSYSSKESRITRYGLGEESSVTIISPSRVHYIYFPLKLSYFTSKDEFGMGYNMGYLLNVESKVETYELKQSTKSNYQSYVTAGYTEGFSIFDSQLNLFYRRKIYKDLYVNTELFFGLKDVKNDVFFSTSQFERNSGIKISLLYTMFKK